MAIPNWIVTDAVPHPDYTLLVSFADGTKKTIDLHGMLEKRIFSPLKNIDFFMKARVECGTVVWNDEIDIAPEWLYEAQ